MNRKLEMHTAETIRSLMLATSLAASVTLVAGSKDASAACAPRDHRANCDATISPTRANTQPSQQPTPMWEPTVRVKNGATTYYNNPREHVVIGSNRDGTPIYSKTPASEKIYERVNKDGSVDRVQEFRQGDGPLEVRILQHTPPRPPKRAELCGGELFGICC
jgi:hypothetical protein